MEVRAHLTDGAGDGDAQLVIRDLVATQSHDPAVARDRSAAASAAGAAAIGADAALTKPFDGDVFTGTVRASLGT